MTNKKMPNSSSRLKNLKHLPIEGFSMPLNITFKNFRSKNLKLDLDQNNLQTFH